MSKTTTKKSFLSSYIKKKSVEMPAAKDSAYQMSLYRVLLVEDDFDDQILAKKELKDIECIGKVTCFSNGKDLIQYLRQRIAEDKNFVHLAPIIIILDLGMPLMNGFETLRALKAHSDYEDIKVIVITGKETRWNKEKAFAYKADAVFEKPINISMFQKFFEENAGRL